MKFKMIHENYNVLNLEKPWSFMRRLWALRRGCFCEMENIDKCI